MKRLSIPMTVALALTCGTCAVAGTAQAKEISIFSKGSIIYQQDDMEVALYAQDMQVLKDKLATIPEDTFDPGSYACTTQQETVHELDLEIMDESNHRNRRDIDETGLDQGYEPVEDEQTNMEIEDDTEIPEQTETVDDSTQTDPSEGNSSENEDTENISSSTEPTEEDLPEGEDAEDTIISTEPTEGKSPEGEDVEGVSASADLSEENSPASGDTENGSALDGVPTENLPEVRDIEEQIITTE